MKVKKREKIEITITLSKEEAYWLKGLCQNFISDNYNETEEKSNRKHRERLWDLLNREGI